MSSPKTKTTTTVAAFAVALAALTSCAGTAPVSAETAPAETPKPTVTAAPAPTATATPEATVEPTPEVIHASCDDAPQGRPAEADEVAEGTVFGLIPTALVDSGPRAGASGEALLNDDGTALSYVVIDGDTKGAIAERFCTSFDYIDLLNVIRRERLGDIHAGDTLNLSPFTMTTVGDIKGVVNDNDVSYLGGDIPLPPQH